MKKLILSILFFGSACGEPLLEGGDLSSWEYRSFDDIAETGYEVREDEELGGTAVFADSQSGASGYTREISVTPQETPWLHFQWRIDEAGGGFDERTKSGDDFAFRIYFAARDGLRYKSLSLVRAQAERGESWKSPYARWFNDLRTYTVIGGDEATGEWRVSSVNLSEVWRELFKEEAPLLELVGFMTDGDSSSSRMKARYGDIVLTDSSLPPF